jgi:hypothetical protein
VQENIAAGDPVEVAAFRPPEIRHANEGFSPGG